jgi:glucosamine-6-phosphate deaminase
LHKGEILENLAEAVVDKTQILQKIRKGKEFLSSPCRVLHTTPHHDDIMLSYFPLLQKMKNYPQRVLCVTSGINSVRESFVKQLLEKDVLHKKGKNYADLLEEFSKAYLHNDEKEMLQLEAALLQCKLFLTYPGSEKEIPNIVQSLEEGKIHPWTNLLKTFVRETEEDRLWKLIGLSQGQVLHMRSKFYHDLTKASEDIHVLGNEIEKFSPDILTLAMDPFETGPETHHKVLQVIASALKTVKNLSNVKIWGYRNVWSKFTLLEATHYFPVEEKDFIEQSKAFYSCYQSQFDALYPSSEYEGPFSELATKIQKQHCQKLCSLLGEELFKEQLQDAEGLILIKEMNVEEFLSYAESIQKRHPWKIN